MSKSSDAASRDWIRDALRLACATLLTVAACAVIGIGTERLAAALSQWNALAVLWMPLALTALLIATRALAPAATGGGIPLALAALRAPDQRGDALSLRAGFVKTVATPLFLGMGASLGREGPAVQIGGAFAYSLFPAADRRDRDLAIAFGAAVGIAATFITPVAGLAFAVEQLRWRPSLRWLAVTVLAVFVAAELSRNLCAHACELPQAMSLPGSSPRWIDVLLCGICSGLLGGMFARALLGLSATLKRAGRAVIVSLGCGLVLGLLAWVGGKGIAGPGVAAVATWLNGAPAHAGWSLIKWATTLISAAPSYSGGLVSPSLAIGGGLGAELASLLGRGDLTDATLLGAAAYLAAVSRTPITAALIVVEGMHATALLIPIICSVFVATLISALICREPLFLGLARVALETPVGRAQ